MVDNFVFYCVCDKVWMCECVSALMNSQSVTEYRPWQHRTDEMIQKQTIVLALITSVGGPEQILWVEVDDGVKLLSGGLRFLMQNNCS